MGPGAPPAADLSGVGRVISCCARVTGSVGGLVLEVVEGGVGELAVEVEVGRRLTDESGQDPGERFRGLAEDEQLQVVPTGAWSDHEVSDGPGEVVVEEDQVDPVDDRAAAVWERCQTQLLSQPADLSLGCVHEQMVAA